MSVEAALQIALIAIGIVLCGVIVFVPGDTLQGWADSRGISKSVARMALLAYVIVPVAVGAWAVTQGERILWFVRFMADLSR